MFHLSDNTGLTKVPVIPHGDPGSWTRSQGFYIHSGKKSSLWLVGLVPLPSFPQLRAGVPSEGPATLLLSVPQRSHFRVRGAPPPGHRQNARCGPILSLSAAAFYFKPCVSLTISSALRSVPSTSPGESGLLVYLSNSAQILDAPGVRRTRIRSPRAESRPASAGTSLQAAGSSDVRPGRGAGPVPALRPCARPCPAAEPASPRGIAACLSASRKGGALSLLSVLRYSRKTATC